MIGPAPLLFLLYRITAHCQAFCPQKPPLTEGKVSTGVGVMSKMMCLRNDVVPVEQMMCLRKDVPLRGNGGGGCRRSGG